MSEQGNANFQIPTEMRDFAEKSVDQARKAMDGFMSAAQRAAEAVEGSTNTMQSSAKDMTRRTLSFAEQNLHAAFDHAQRLVRAQDPTEAMRLQTEFVQSQFAALQAQMRDFGGLMQDAARQTAQTASNAAQSAARTAATAAQSANQTAPNPTKR